MTVHLAEATAPRLFTARFDNLVERAGERLNPILVKETRQALKSRQFVTTFSLLLVAAWIWSLIGVAMLSPGVYFAPSGPFLLTGYLLILAVPLLLVVPFSSFWSLAREREDQTYELLSITALSSRQIITGKLGSAILQLLVYYSALAPCIAFTYLLRGVDVLSSGFMLMTTLVTSILFSLFGLVMAAITRARHWQMLIAVVLLIGLLIGSYACVATTLAMVYGGGMRLTSAGDFWLGCLAFLTLAATYFFLLLRLAAAQISFASDNRSTAVRQAMLAQLCVFVGWMAFWFFREGEDTFLYMTMVFAGIHWAVYGALMNGETAQLSPRAKRRLPQSLLGRSFLTWFNPGAETGYIFASATFTALTIVVVCLGVAGDLLDVDDLDQQFPMFAAVVWAYFVLYMGLGRTIIAILGRYLQIGAFGSLLVHGMMLLVAALAPTFFQAWLEGFNDLSYSALQMPNWFWTIGEVGDNRNLTAVEVGLIVACAALVMLLLHLVAAKREVRHVRSLVPERVAADDDMTSPEISAR